MACCAWYALTGYSWCQFAAFPMGHVGMVSTLATAVGSERCFWSPVVSKSLQWRHIGRDGVSNHQPHHCLLNRLFRRRSNKTSKLHVTGLCAGNSPVIGELPAQMASDAENVSIWLRYHVTQRSSQTLQLSCQTITRQQNQLCRSYRMWTLLT